MADQRAAAATPEGLGIYRDFDAFVKQSVKDYYDRGWTTRRGNFIALLIASGQTLSLAKDSVVDGTGTKKVAIGAAAVMALQLALRFVLGPVGIVLTGAAAASLVAYFIRNQKDILKKVQQYKVLIADVEKKYDAAQSDWRDGKYDLAQRNLMIDGLMKRFVADVDEA